MRVLGDERVIELTRTNLLSLLAKLDGHPANSACTIGGHEGWYVRAVEDQAHYADRPRGQMHPATEASLTHPLIEDPARPYKSMKALDVLCPYCNAAPCEPCRSVRVPEVARTATFSSQPGTAYRRVKRPHPERVYAARHATSDGSA